MFSVSVFKKLHGPSYVKYIESPIGTLGLVASDTALQLLIFENELEVCKEGLANLLEARDHPVLCQAEEQLKEYFAGQRTEFTLPLDMPGTDFQRQVWSLLQQIPYGETTSYGELAARIGDAKKCRAVGLANGANPIAIIVPCHRVIGKNGALTGFGGGLPMKEFLLKLEKGKGTE